LFTTILNNIAPEQLILLIFLLLSTGIFAGVIAGLFGVGGGVVIVPALYYIFTLAEIDESTRMHLAVGTSLANIIPTSIISAYSHAKRKAVDFKLLQLIGPSIVIGVILGAVIASNITGSMLMLTYAVLLFLVALQFFFWQDKWKIADTFPTNNLKNLFGTSIGFLSTIIGIGGGSLSIPLLKLYSFPIHKAIGTAAAIGTLIAIPGTVGFIISGIYNEISLPLSIGYVNFLGLLMISPMTVISAPLGVRFAHHLSQRTLNKIFSIFIFCMSARLFLEWLS
jgi:uncharacterized membrane protein YfcA|tara:strand:+ start:1182 stop:2024 length:843 start_codon:yes stop_codon:yes gene_type:complete